MLTRCAQRAQTPPRLMHCRGEAQWRPLSSDNISYQAVARNILLIYLFDVKGSGKAILDERLDSDQHKNLTTSRGLSLAHA